MADKENEILLRADLPGFDKDDINVRVTEDTVDIYAKRKGEKREEKEGYYYRKRALSAVRRSLTLPSTVDPNSVEADLRNGVLTLRMKKKESKKSREVKIR
jgi:HSP20 family protein